MTPNLTIEDLTAAIDELAEGEFWDGADLDAITNSILVSWLEAKSCAGYTEPEIVAALHAVADDLASRTFH